MRSREVPGLFDVPDVVVLTSEVSEEALARITEREAALVAKAVDKRKREFATARALAREALARFGHAEVEVLSAPDRAPIWPAGIAGSISHCDTRAVVAIARRERSGTVGVDVEHRDELKRELWKTVFLEREIAYLDRAFAEPARRGRFALALFSAKEALYKAQYPWSETFMGFHDLLVELEPSGEDASVGTLRCIFQKDVPPFARGTIALGRYALDAFAPGEEVVTAVRIPAASGRT